MKAFKILEEFELYYGNLFQELFDFIEKMAENICMELFPLTAAED